MPQYRLFTLCEDGHISAPAVILECECDQEAVEAAKQHMNGHAVELWNGARQVAKLPAQE